MTTNLDRRRFLLQAGTSVSAAWITANWTSVLSAATHAHEAAQAAALPKLEFFTPAEVIEVDAITARIIPADDSPGAREAGTVYFIDRALVTFAVDEQKTYRDGLPQLQAHVRELFPGVEKFSAATIEQQEEILHSVDPQTKATRRRATPQAGAHSLFETVRIHTIAAFLADPDTRGDRHGYGWKLIGREREHMFSSPFGFYDKDYPGWQPLPKSTETK